MFYRTIFKDNVKFSGSIFNDAVFFDHVTFNKTVIFFSTTFKNKCNFFRVTFNNLSLFQLIKSDILIFIGSIFFDRIKLNNKSHLHFLSINENCFYDKTNKCYKKSKINIRNTIIKGRIEFDNIKIGEIDLKGSDIIGGGVVNRINFKAYPANWQTASFLKHEAIVRDNTIEALEYKAIEKDLHRKELLIKPNKNIQEWGEYLSLLISKLSNNHGQSWIQAVIFTLLSGLLFFILSIATGVFDNIKDLTMSDFFINYVKYLIPTNFELIKCIDKSRTSTTILFLIFYILGKISIGYGIVEVVQAFRKFNTKGN